MSLRSMAKRRLKAATLKRQEMERKAAAAHYARTGAWLKAKVCAREFASLPAVRAIIASSCSN
jgi:hypothetical protein